MKEYKISTTGAGQTDWIRLDTRGDSLHTYTIVIEILGTAVVDLEMAVQRDLTDPVCIVHDILQNLNVSASSVHKSPASAMRLSVSGVGSNTVVNLFILQG